MAVDTHPLRSSYSIHGSQCIGDDHRISSERILLVPSMGYYFLLLYFVPALSGSDGSLPLNNEQGHALEGP